MPFSRAVDDAILGVFKGTSFTGYSNLYVALLTTQPSQNDGTGLVEVVAGSSAGQWTGYVRVSVGTLSSAWSAISGTSTRAITNANVISFGTVTISSGTITVTGFAVYDASSAGNLVAYGTLTGGSLVFNNTDLASFAIGALTVSEA